MQCCEDEEEIDDVLDSLSDEELSIIKNTDDISVVIKIRNNVLSDLDDTFKALCME